jgi:hypothetical protein
VLSWVASSKKTRFRMTVQHSFIVVTIGAIVLSQVVTIAKLSGHSVICCEKNDGCNS